MWLIPLLNVLVLAISFCVVRALVLVVLKSHIAFLVFSTTNTKKQTTMVEEKPKNLA